MLSVQQDFVTCEGKVLRVALLSRRSPIHQAVKPCLLTGQPVRQHISPQPHTCPHFLPTCAVLRSKGFMWMSNSHTTAYYWSHAGQHFEIRDEGDWWVAVPDEEWPEDPRQREVVVQVS